MPELKVAAFSAAQFAAPVHRLGNGGLLLRSFTSLLCVFYASKLYTHVPFCIEKAQMLPHGDI